MSRIIKTIIYLSLILTPSWAFAAQLFFDAPEEALEGDNIRVEVLLDTEDESINAIEGVIVLDEQHLQLNSVTNGNSIIPLWIEKPAMRSPGKVNFAGIVPGGYGPLLSDKGKIVELFFRAESQGTATLRLQDFKIFSNNTLPEEIKVNHRPASIVIKPSDDNIDRLEPLVLDFDIPEPFEIELVKTPDLFDNQNVLIFSTQDKASGTSHYEVNESFLGLFGEWKIAESPYLLSDQNLFSIIKVKAYDNVGHERVETFVPNKFWFLASLILISISGLIIILVRKIFVR